MGLVHAGFMLPALKLNITTIILAPCEKSAWGHIFGGNRHEEQKTIYIFLRNSK